jgi:hypothetical protein
LSHPGYLKPFWGPLALFAKYQGADGSVKKDAHSIFFRATITLANIINKQSPVLQFYHISYFAMYIWGSQKSGNCSWHWVCAIIAFVASKCTTKY